MPTAAVQPLATLQFPGVRLGGGAAEPLRHLPTGIAALDELLGGGLPRGHLSEIVGGPSSGRTALLLALLAAATRRGEVAALIDLPDALDPRSLARAGADLERVLWVRPPSPQLALKCAELILGAGGFGVVALDNLGASAARPLPRHVWPRLAQVTRRAGAACLICAPRRLASGAAAVALSLTARHTHWDGRLFDGLTARAVLARSRFVPAERAVELTFGDGAARRRGSSRDGPKAQTENMKEKVPADRSTVPLSDFRSSGTGSDAGRGERGGEAAPRRAMTG